MMAKKKGKGDDFDRPDDDALDRAEFDGMLSHRPRRRYGGYGGYGYSYEQSYDNDWNDGWWNGWKWGRAVKEKSHTALDVDAWGLRRGKNMCSEWNKAERKKAEENGTEPVIHDEYAVADAFTSLYEPLPRIAEDIDPEDLSAVQRAEWMAALMETPDYKSLHAASCMEYMVSEAASASISSAWTAYKKQIDQMAADGTDGGIGGELAKIRGIRDALEAAASEAKAVEDVRGGCGMGDGGGDTTYDKKAFKKVFNKVKDNDTLKKIFEKAGRMWRYAAGCQRRKVAKGVEEVVGVELSGDIRHILNQELGMLACDIEAVRLEALARLSDRQMLSRKRSGSERVGKGPIITVVDESGSMSGDPIIMAKAVALTMARIAKAQNRWAGFVGFSGGCNGTRLAMPPNKWDSDKLLKWLEHFYSGGTSLDVPVNEMPDTYWPEFMQAGMPAGKTDVVFITDAQLNAPEKYVQKFKRWKLANEVRSYGIILNSPPGDMTKLCDQTWTMKAISTAEEAIQAVFSV